MGWNFYGTHATLQHLIPHLRNGLNGCAPWRHEEVDQLRWKNSIYIIKKGCISLIFSHNSPPKSNMWKNICTTNASEKVNTFVGSLFLILG